MVNTYAVQSGGCRFESLWGFGFYLKGAHYEVDYSGKKTYLAGLQCTLTSSCAKSGKVFEKSQCGKTFEKFRSIRGSNPRTPVFWPRTLTTGPNTPMCNKRVQKVDGNFRYIGMHRLKNGFQWEQDQ